MNSYQIYEDIATRTNGDIYLGVVGPVRCGKSTFITNFVQKMVLPNIKDSFDKTRTIDELPQSADGKTIMTTQPRFVPKEAVKIVVNDKVQMKIRLVDCVGYSVTGAEGLIEDGKPRLVKTPWNAEPIPFEEAAEVGTKKVISDHKYFFIKEDNKIYVNKEKVQKLNKAASPLLGARDVKILNGRVLARKNDTTHLEGSVNEN